MPQNPGMAEVGRDLRRSPGEGAPLSLAGPQSHQAPASTVEQAESTVTWQRSEVPLVFSKATCPWQLQEVGTSHDGVTRTSL